MVETLDSRPDIIVILKVSGVQLLLPVVQRKGKEEMLFGVDNLGFLFPITEGGISFYSYPSEVAVAAGGGIPQSPRGSVVPLIEGVSGYESGKIPFEGTMTIINKTGEDVIKVEASLIRVSKKQGQKMQGVPYNDVNRFVQSFEELKLPWD